MSMRATIICALLLGFTAAASAADRLPSGPTYKEAQGPERYGAGARGGREGRHERSALESGRALAPERPGELRDEDAPPILLAHSSIDNVVAVEQSERLYRKYLENGLDASLFLWSRGAHGAVGLDIEAASSEWLVRKLLVELAPHQAFQVVPRQPKDRPQLC